jgi:hypothetical protein
MTVSSFTRLVCAAGALAAASLLPAHAQAPRLSAEAVAAARPGPRHRPRLALHHAHEARRPAQPAARADARRDHAAWRRGAPGAPAAAPDGDRLLIRFSYPNDIKGTSFLVWEHPGAEDERFLFLPSLGRVRRIAGSETQDSFVGSDFTYEDIGGREYEDYAYGFAGADGENASWTPPGGAARAAWRLESKHKDAAAEFPRVVSLVLKDSFLVVAADIFNRRNERQKVYTVRRIDQVENIWTVMDSEISNALEKTRTELTVERADYNVGLKEADFSRRELERGAGRPGGTP